MTHAAVSSALPLVSSGGFSSFQFPSPLRGGALVDVESIRRVVSPDYFDALGIRLRAGRPLMASDTESAPLAVVVNRSFVAKYLDDLPIEQAIGFTLGGNAVRLPNGGRDAFIVGVVDDMKQDGPDDPPQPEMFVGFAQLPGAAGLAGFRGVTHARRSGDAQSRRCAPRFAKRIRPWPSMR